MEDFGEILYFILIIAFALISGLSKKKKKGNQPQPGKAEVPDVPTSWEEIEKKFKEITNPSKTQPATATRTAASTNKPQQSTYRQTEKSGIPKGYPETIYSSENDRREILSYDTVDDVSKMRIKKQVKESVSRKQSTFKTTTSPIYDESIYNPIDIEFDDIQDVRKAFIYSEIFNRKYD